VSAAERLVDDAWERGYAARTAEQKAQGCAAGHHYYRRGEDDVWRCSCGDVAPKQLGVREAS
jgi:hypothetical protein